MEKTLEFADLVQLLDERSAAFRDVVAAAPDLGAQVPTCPEWTLLDLAEHIGQGRLRWAVTVAAGPADTPPPFEAPAAPRDREALLTWLAAAMRELSDALRAAGPDRGVWTWWGDSQSPQTSGAVARHQLQQLAVHTYDAQITVGTPPPLPADVALDGVDEFLSTCVATTSAWPHEPTSIEYRIADGPSWRLDLSGSGVQVTRSAAGEAREPAGVSVTGTAGELVLFFYGRTAVEAMKYDGDRTILDQIIAWDPSA